MNAKEKLQQYRVCCRKYDAVLENIERTRSLAEKTTQSFGGDPVQSSTSDRFGNICSIFADMITDAENELKELYIKQKEVEKLINEVKNSKYRDVLYHRYILQKKWERIAVDLNYDYSWVIDMHGKALNEIKLIITD